MIGLTGTEAQIAAVAKEYAASYQKMPAPPGATGYLMQHSSIAILFGPDGAPIAMVPVDSNAAAVADTLRKWVK
jgi:protein SCO1/2